MICNSTGPQVLPSVTVEITGGEDMLTFYVGVENKELIGENAAVYAAIYGADGRLLTAAAAAMPSSGRTGVNAQKADGAKTAKVFVWNSNMQPAAEAWSAEL